MKTKEFDLYKVMTITTIIAAVVALLFQIDYSGVDNPWQDFLAWVEAPLEWKQGHYVMLLVAIVVYGNKK